MVKVIVLDAATVGDADILDSNAAMLPQGITPEVLARTTVASAIIDPAGPSVANVAESTSSDCIFTSSPRPTSLHTLPPDEIVTWIETALAELAETGKTMRVPEISRLLVFWKQYDSFGA